INMQEAADAVLKSLTYKNANNDCKKALDLICNCTDVELSDYVKSSTNISLEQFKAELITTAVTQQLQVTRATIKCFGCREQEHIRKQCPKGQKGNKKPSKPCPCYQKEFHWNNQCWSKYYKDGNPLPDLENSKGCGTPQPNRITLNQTPM
ncbi:GAK5 protein, partial [Orthonyx spaldingii]|nr:GAK5 protein [Orthonyx spaldingii]